MVAVELFEQFHGRRASALPETPLTKWHRNTTAERESFHNQQILIVSSW